MKKKFMVTISGTPGSGKSTIAEALTKKFKAKRLYAGAMMRRLAKEKNLTLAEFYKNRSANPKIDVEVDERVAAQARKLIKKTNVIVEGRTQFHFLPESIKIYIKVSPREGAKRIWLSLQKPGNKKERNEAHVHSLAALLKKNLARKANDLKLYKKYYNLNYTKESQYDFVLDTTHINAQQATTKTAVFIKNYLK
jgi:cytidylate kinase